jgi:phage-related protein
VQDVLSSINTSAINKPIATSVSKITGAVQKYEAAYSNLRTATIKAGESTQEYKDTINELDDSITRTTSNLNASKKSYESNLSSYKSYLAKKAKAEQQLAVDPNNEGARIRLADAEAGISTNKNRMVKDEASIAKLTAELENLIEKRKHLDPIEFADKASASVLDRLATLTNKVLSLQKDLTTEMEDYNKTIADNRASDEYNELLKQAEKYKKQLADLNEKSKEMEFKGATDNQWENLRKETEWTSKLMDEVISKMDKAVKSGKAFRFGEGPKGEFRNQINSFKMSAQNNAGYAAKRARDNQSPYTEDYQKSLDELDKLEKKVEAIREKSAKMIELGASKQQFASLTYDAESLDIKIDEVKNHLMNVVSEGKAFKFGSGDADAEISKIRDKSGSLQSTLTGVATNAKKAQGGLTALGATHPKLAAVLGVVGKIGTALGHVLKGAAKVGKAIVTGFGSAVKTLGKVTSYIGKITSGLFGNKASSSANSNIKKLTKNILMWGFGFRTVYYAVKRLRNIFIEGFKTMGEQFDEVGQPMMRMMESFNRLKGSLATAFQPIVSVVMPILTRFMDYLSGVLEGIGKFMATLTGQGYIYKAVAKDINSVAGAAKNANKQLGSYDKLEVISNDNGSGYDYEKQTVGEAESAASSFAQMVKDAWENADFTGVGVYVTEKLLGVLENVEKNIVPKVTEFVNRLLKSVNTFLTGFDSNAIGGAVGSILNALTEGLDWSQIGQLFANLNNTVWQFLDGLANSIDWTVLGQSISTGLVSLVDTLDFDSLANTISGLIMGLVDVVTNIDWGYIADKLFFGVMTILNTVGTKMSESDNPIVAAFGGVVLSLQEAIEGLKPSIDTIIQAVGPIIESILPVISSLLPPISSIINVIVTTLLPPIVRLIQAVMPLLTSLVQLIMPGLERTITRVAGVFGVLIDIVTVCVGIINGLVNTAKIVTGVFRGEFSSIKSVFSELLKAWKTPINSIIAGIEGMVNGIIRGMNGLIKGLNKVSFNIPDWVPAIGGKKFGINIPSLSNVSIPRLAQGAVIPPNKEFIAMLGDQKRGTNIEAPLDTIKQALAEVLAEVGGGSREPIVLEVNGRVLAKVVWDEQEKRYKQTGKYSPA